MVMVVRTGLIARDVTVGMITPMHWRLFVQVLMPAPLTALHVVPTHALCVIKGRVMLGMVTH
jgi:hypothetical protein